MCTRLMLSINDVCGSCWESKGTTMCGMMMWDGKQSNHIFRILFKHGDSPCSVTLHEWQMNQMPSRSNSFPLGELEETSGTPPYYMDEDYPAGPGIIEPLPKGCIWRGSESSTLENDVYVWRYVVDMNEWMNEWFRHIPSGGGTGDGFNG